MLFYVQEMCIFWANFGPADDSVFSMDLTVKLKYLFPRHRILQIQNQMQMH